MNRVITGTKEENYAYMDRLRSMLKVANEAYHSGAEPAYTDSEYDSLFSCLQDYEEKYPEYIPDDSPTLTVGAQVGDR